VFAIELPDVLAEDRHGGSRRVEAIDLDLWPSDHEVRVHARDVHAVLEEFGVGHDLGEN
jgi:hypothetical protein